MEDSFNVRVDKTFGSLSSPPPPPPPPPLSSSSTKSQSLSSLWCLTDEEIEKREWNRDRDSPEPVLEPRPLRSKGFFENIPKGKAMDFRAMLERDLYDLDDDDNMEAEEEEEEEEAREKASSSGAAKPDDYNDEEWEVKSSIGLDCTLDYEEEEDEYDKVAIGKEKAGDRLYMRDVNTNDYQTDADAYDELPTSFKDFIRDPRANHLAAKLRLQEDAEAAKQIDSLRVSDNEDGHLKSILKRGDGESDSKPPKRVRFDSECKSSDGEGSEGTKDAPIGCSTEEPQDHPSGIPDYMRNPSKYTKYTFDSSGDIDEASNRQAFMDFLKMINKSKSDGMESEEHDASNDLPKSVAFIPRKKASAMVSNDTTMIECWSEAKQSRVDSGKQSMQNRGLRIGISARDTEETEVCVMEEDESQTVIDRKSRCQRAGRQYRMKSSLEVDES